MSEESTTEGGADSARAGQNRWLDRLLGSVPRRPVAPLDVRLPWPSADDASERAWAATAAVPDGSPAAGTLVRVPLPLPLGIEQTGEATLIRIEVNDLPPGAVVTPAKDLGDGSFEISPEDAERLTLVLDPADAGEGPLRLNFKTVAEDPVDGSVLTSVSARDVQLPRVARPPAPEPASAAAASPPPEMSSPAPANPSSPPDFTADLDISVGIDDPETLRGITITVIGVPSGGRLSAGEEIAPGRWQLAADRLADLSISVPGDTGDFTLEIVLETADGESQSAELEVAAASPPPVAEEVTPARAPALEAPEPEPSPPPRPSAARPQPVEGGSGAIVVRLGSEPYRGDPHYRIYADGRQIADGNLDWEQPPGAGALVWQDVVVPWSFDGAESRPKQLGVRYETEGSRGSGGGERSLSLGFIEVDGLRIAADAAEVTAPEGWVEWHDADGLTHRSWQGELQVDVAAAFARDAGDEAAPAEISAEAPPPVEPETAADAEAEEPEPASSPPHDPRLLVIPAEERDLANPAFLAEIVELRNFVRATAAGEATDLDLSGNRLYDRLGVDVGRWHDVALRDARGRDINLDLPVPSLAPAKGRTYSQVRRRLRLGDLVAGGYGDSVEISGLPPGALLDHGVNLGDGRWRLGVREARTAHLLTAFGGPREIVLEAALVQAPAGRTLRRHTVHASRPGSGADLPAETRRIRLPLDHDVFDPRRYGNVTLTLTDVPPGTLLSRGTNHGDGVWTLEGWEGERLSLVAAAAPARRAGIKVTAMSFDEASGETEFVARDVVIEDGRDAVLMAPPAEAGEAPATEAP